MSKQLQTIESKNTIWYCIETSDDVVLATWKFLVDGKPTNIEALQEFPRYTVS